jgi:hypothetical protein
MCKQVKCLDCGKATWVGCGEHVDKVLKGVAIEDRCRGWRDGICEK